MNKRLSTKAAAPSAGTSPVPRLALALMMLLGACGGSEDEGAVGTTAADRGVGSTERVLQTAQHALHANASSPVACEGCHELVGDQYLKAQSWRCQNCHSDASLMLHSTAGESSPARECWSCHDFASAEKQTTACLSCHTEAQGALAAITPHDPAAKEEACSSCHRAHAARADGADDCASCHDKTQVSGHQAENIPITGCASCHGYHEEATVASGRCTNCHRQSRAKVSVNATFEGGHEKCVSCHRSHQFEKGEVRTCTDGCHEEVVALSEDKVKEHRGCIGCHDNHDVRATPEKSCERCHDKLTPQHPKDRETGTRCVGCHKPHTGKGTPLAMACTNCHQNAKTDRGLHQGAKNRAPACRSCHEPHRFRLASADTSFCASCHGKKPFANAPSIRTHAKHSQCMSCHGEEVAHQPAGPRAECSSCHQEKAKVTHAKHRNCVGCHEPHTTAQKKPCGGCHEEQKRTAPAKHQDCQQCHDEHSTAVQTTCQGCHKDRTTGIHRAVKGGCESCHRAHGPGGKASPPTCTSCHTKPRPGLHREAKHQQCADCHRSHGTQPYRTRAACLGCHEAQKNHEPMAKLCIGCHVFGGSQ